MHNIKKDIISLIYVVLAALAIRIFVLELFFVPTPSMKATILENDYVFSTKYSYGYSRYSIPWSPNLFSGRIFASEPQRGDVVIFRPPMNMEIRYIKRLIGMPGDKVQLINDLIYINDQPIERERVGEFIDESGQKYLKYKETLPNKVSYYSYKVSGEYNHGRGHTYGSTEAFYVPAGHYFFLGDNRDESRDSRVDLGFVPFENFIAKGHFIYFSTSELLFIDNITIFEQIKRVGTWLSSIRIHRFFKGLNL